MHNLLRAMRMLRALSFFLVVWLLANNFYAEAAEKSKEQLAGSDKTASEEPVSSYAIRKLIDAGTSPTN